MDNGEARVINVRLDQLSSSVERLANVFEEMQKQMHVLTAMKVQQDHINAQLATGAETMTKHAERIGKIESDMPGLRELRRWVITGVLAGLGMMGAALGKLVIVDVPRGAPAPTHLSKPDVTGQ